jgi:hypothetical protein
MIGDMGVAPKLLAMIPTLHLRESHPCSSVFICGSPIHAQA